MDVSNEVTFSPSLVGLSDHAYSLANVASMQQYDSVKHMDNWVQDVKSRLTDIIRTLREIRDGVL